MKSIPKPFASIDEEAGILADRLDSLMKLYNDFQALPDQDKEFAGSLIQQYADTHSLSGKQWMWVDKLLERAQPIYLYGDFTAIQVMFQIAGEHLKYPKIRLLTDEGTYVQLNFYPETRKIKIFRDGWQGHGKRRFCGIIESDRIIPHSRERLDKDIELTLQAFSLDPQQIAKTMAARLGACMYCGQRLSDTESKERGYGPICAGHYGLPHNGYRAPVPTIDLSDMLFT